MKNENDEEMKLSEMIIVIGSLTAGLFFGMWLTGDVRPEDPLGPPTISEFAGAVIGTIFGLTAAVFCCFRRLKDEPPKVSHIRIPKMPPRDKKEDK
jgi:hypothetical protein